MNKKIIFLAIVVLIALVLIFKMQINNDKENKTNVENNANAVSVDPVSHASMILNWDGKAIYTDPVGEAQLFAGKPVPDIILLTDIHGDHLDVERLKTIVADKTVIVAPQAVLDLMPEELKARTLVINNGETINQLGFKVEAMPMYNIPESETAFHTKGRGNGYVIEKGNTRVYVSGDTAGIPEMRNLKDIDMAFVAMNLPYTMGVEEAADAVLEFKPKEVYPYHYRQNPTNDFADVAKFKEIVNSKNPEIKVVQLKWY